MELNMQDTLKVKGARSIERELDLTELDAATLERIIDYWFGVVTSRASAGVDTFADKVKAETEMADKLMTFDWAKGGGGGGARLSLHDQANRDILTDLFMGQGLKKTEAEKRARGKDAWTDFIRLGMARALDKSGISEMVRLTRLSHAEVATELEKQQPEITRLIDEREAALKAEAERAAKLAKSGLTFGS